MSQAAGERPKTEAEMWAGSAFELLAAIPGVHRAGLALIEAGGRRLSFTADDRDNGGATDWCEVDAYEDVPLNNTVRTGNLIAGSLEELAGRYPEFIGRQASSTRSLATVPLVAAGRVLGGFALFYRSRQRFDDPQRERLRRLGERLGTELRRGRTTLLHRSPAVEAAPAGASVALRVFDADPHEVASARHFVRDTLAGWDVDEDVSEVAVLCVSELVTNAIIHTVAGCEVRLVLDDRVLTVSVRDGGSSARRAESAAEDPLAVHGRGLQLVDAFSARWGSRLDTVGRTVWCELEVG